MADEQLEKTPSADAQPTDAPSAEPVSEAAAESSKAPSWWQRMFHRGGPQETEQQPEDSSESEPASNKLSLTQEELDRRVQAEADRREYKRQGGGGARGKRVPLVRTTRRNSSRCWARSTTRQVSTHW